jgi:ketosteroid isomerase-like protein
MFRVYTSDDPVGVQIGGAVKNVIAIAAGACDGLGLGTNARAALIARGLAEITRLGVALGADPLTFLGMAGVGDLILTCTGALSRNRELGMKVAEGVDPKAYLASKRSVAEGFWTSAATHALAKKRGVDMPITEQVFHVLHEGRPLLEALKLLVTRDFKGELLGIKVARGPLEIAQSYLGAIERGDREALEGLLAPDVVFEELPNKLAPKGSRRDRATILASFEKGKDLLARQTYEVKSASATGDAVALEVAWTGVTKDGKELKASSAMFIETHEGQVTRQRNYDCFE